jgi:nicotinate-nucleotide pyrophosphorylase (carboxylating)
MTSDLSRDGRISRLIESALLEDLGAGDVTSEAIVAEDAIGFAEILCKAPGVIAGLEVAAEVFANVDPGLRFESLLPDGSPVCEGLIAARVRGSARGILQGERTALNFLQRMSGIATLTRAYVDAVAGTRARISDTRKTAPGLRAFDKLAVRLGGGVNHRFGLDDMVLIKDNHIVAAGSISRAVELCRASLERRRLHITIEVETKNLEEVEEALRCTGITRIMLDNFPPDRMAEAVRLIGGLVEVEASGGITLDTVKRFAETGVDIISVGALTHSARALDISLELSHHV